MSLPGRLVSVRGVRVFVHESGRHQPARPPVVLLHGWLLSHYMWRHVTRPLVEAGHRVIAIDFPGYGESDRPSPSSYRYDATAFSDTVLDVMDALDVPEAALVGQSLGGAVSIVTAARHPQRVTRVALVDPLVYRVELPPEAFVVQLPVAGLFAFRLGLARKMIRYLMKRDIYHDVQLVTDDWVEYVWERVQRPGGAEAAHRTLHELVFDTSHVVAAMRAVRAPTMIMWGEFDRLFPADLARRLQEDLGGSEVRIIPGCGHSPPEERPEEMLRALLPFLDGQDARARSVA